MKHIKTFKDYKKIDESIIPGGDSVWSDIKVLPLLPLALLGIGIINLFNPRHVEALSEKYLDIYNNLDDISNNINTMINSGNLTDTETRKAKRILKQIERIKKRYPTLEDYKNNLKKTTPIYNIRNSNFLKRKIDEYNPTTHMSRSELEKILKKINKNEAEQISWRQYDDYDFDEDNDENMEELEIPS